MRLLLRSKVRRSKVRRRSGSQTVFGAVDKPTICVPKMEEIRAGLPLTFFVGPSLKSQAGLRPQSVPVYREIAEIEWTSLLRWEPIGRLIVI